MTSILTFSSVKELTSMGVKIIKRFILITLAIMAVSIFVSFLFFGGFGEGSLSLDPDQLIKMLLDIIPTNFIKPFLDNNTPQLVLLGFLLVSALLLLGDSVKELNTVITQINKCVMSAMKIILLVIPGIPFLSIMTIIGRGNGGELLQGWKFIVASYVVYTVCIVIKAVKTTAVTKIGIAECWKRIKPAVMISFSTGSNVAPMSMVYEISERDFNIKPEFSSFWVPMNTAILSPKTTINLVIATFMAAQITGTPISNTFMIALIIVTLELSLASPDTTSAWAIMFETLALPTSYVGLFAAYRLLTANYGAAVTEAYSMLEEVEAAHKLGGVKGDEKAAALDS